MAAFTPATCATKARKCWRRFEEAVTVGKEAGVPVELSHFKIDNKSLWGSSTKSLALVEKYRREGVDVVVDQYPYDRSSTDLGMIAPELGACGWPGRRFASGLPILPPGLVSLPRCRRSVDSARPEELLVRRDRGLQARPCV